jgi:hypothetical protein
MNLHATFRASNLFGSAINSAVVLATQMKNKDINPEEIKAAIFEDVFASITNESTSHLFYAASKLMPTANLSGLPGAANLLDGIANAMTQIVTNDVIRFCGINCATIKELPNVKGVVDVREKKQRAMVKPADNMVISDELRDEMSGANITPGEADNDCGDACKI